MMWMSALGTQLIYMSPMQPAAVDQVKGAMERIVVTVVRMTQQDFPTQTGMLI